MFSRRLNWETSGNQLSLLLKSKRAAGAQIVDLTESNPTQVGVMASPLAVLDALGDPSSLVDEPNPAGLIEARRAVAGYYQAQGAKVEPEQILLTASTSEAYSFLFKLLADPGEELLAPRPSYPLFDHLAALDSICLAYYPLRYQEGWWMDLDALEQQITVRTRAVIVVHPNNPTGSFLKRAELKRLEQICLRHKLALISDEVFADYELCPDAERFTTVASASEAMAFSLSGLSKLIGLPQMKLGWIVCNEPEAIRRLEWIADTYLSVSAPVQHATAKWLELRSAFQQELKRRLRVNLDCVSSNMDTLRVEGGWSAIVRLPGLRADEQWALDLLNEADVLVQPGYFYDFEQESLVVVSLLTAPELLQEGIRRMKEFTDGVV
ncbi:MAG: pyridoxal phosphate-dependent aminotransferase [Acidimicrobiia bacterium]|nr:pyridoxal phosphate-dependent aminotransferase [Acidimicrobiia bacterium]